MIPPTSLPCIQELTERPGGAPRILLVRLSAVGDCVQTMPLACALRDRFPGAHLTWVVEKAAAPLVAANDAVDRLIVVPKRFLYSPATLRWLKHALGRERIDLTFDPQGLTKSGVVAWLSRAARRIGLARPAAREINPWLQTELISARAAHRVDRYLELLRPLGIERPAVRFGLRLTADSGVVVSSLGQHSPAISHYVALNPGAGWDSKRWPPERFAEVARHLRSRGLASVVTWGGPQERTWAESIVAASGGAAALAPPTSLLELATLLRGARLFIGSDTGPLHLAAAVGTPCVALFGASEAAACGPYGRGHLCLQAALDSSAGRKRRGADNWAMRRISTDLVCKAACHLLDRQDREMAA